MLEDDLALANLLSIALEDEHFVVTQAVDGAEGLRHVLASDFDVILCDMVMPGFPGDMFYRAVERVRPYLCQRFLFMTGYRRNEKIDAFVQSIGGLLIWKPFQIHELTAAIKVVLSRPANRGDSSSPTPRTTKRHATL